MSVSKINSVSKEELEKLVRESITFSQVLRALGYHEKGGISQKKCLTLIKNIRLFEQAIRQRLGRTLI